MSPAMRERLQAAADSVSNALRAEWTPKQAIQQLVRDHGATWKTGPQTNTLRAAGVTATCTWSPEQGLLDAWRRQATLKLAEARLA